MRPRIGNKREREKKIGGMTQTGGKGRNQVKSGELYVGCHGVANDKADKKEYKLNVRSLISLEGKKRTITQIQ